MFFSTKCLGGEVYDRALGSSEEPQNKSRCNPVPWCVRLWCVYKTKPGCLVDACFARLLAHLCVFPFVCVSCVFPACRVICLLHCTTLYRTIKAVRTLICNPNVFILWDSCGSVVIAGLLANWLVL